MAHQVSRAQIDRLGERLKQGNITEADLRMLDQYRRTFTEAYEIVVRAIRNELGLEPTGRPAKSTTSISDKLRRESIRLTQIQDIAGCRLIVQDITSQDAVVQSLTDLFDHTTVVDRRHKPSHGYRAVHVIVSHSGKTIEVQVRTSLQHLWAELSEKFSDVYDPALKYGGGDEFFQNELLESSELVAKEEELEALLASNEEELKALPAEMRSQVLSQAKLTEEQVTSARDGLNSIRQQIFEGLRDMIKVADAYRGEKDDFSD